MSENAQAEATQATGDKIVKAFFVGSSAHDFRVPMFAEAAVEETDTLHLPTMDDSRDGLRFVDRDGQEITHFMPIMTTCYPGAIIEIKKYVYGHDVPWVPRGLDNSQLTRDRDSRGPVEAALDIHLRLLELEFSISRVRRLLNNLEQAIQRHRP
ncbi:hypothetical protein NPX13_g5748 [Xylaria arbuscula]|uniref:Uncharacterized protein n=1 Tax=Xylaria arbuscula TaxID=114810 RepID=A0A9W8NDW6_9PEZI|nr:hypothetical protein NPX13_g5748 [Xylaria arbuscula]